MTTAPAYTLTHDSITIILDGQPFSIRKGAAQFDLARQAIFNEDWSALPALVTPGHHVSSILGGDYAFVGGFIEYKGRKIDEALNKRLCLMAERGEGIGGWLKFWERLKLNPSSRSVEQTYSFLAHDGIPVDEADGHILAYKSVREDYLDHHSGTFDNSPGNVHEMDRNLVSDDPNHACHAGFHVGALAYASTFGRGESRIVICKVDPKDIVCVPHDSSQMKVRVCRYTVIGNYSGVPLDDLSYSAEKDDVVDDYSRTDDEDEDNFYDEDDDGYEEGQDFDDDAADEDDDGDEDPTVDEMLSWSLDDLRKYARNELMIIGASKIPGGKDALIERILAVRKSA